MLKQVMIGAASAIAIASASLIAGTPAQAAQVGIYVNPGYAPDDSGCWRWSRHSQHWVWACQQQYTENYYSNPLPSFGFSFGGNGDRGDHRHDSGDRHYDRGDNGNGQGDRWDHQGH